MGTKRVEGRIKKKSIKSKVTSRSSSQKKKSMMGKKIKKGLMGPSTDFMTRSAVLKRLQITLKDFRRLCILKGIYPRVPVKAPKGSDKIYYDIKDITYLAHEPLLHKFREFKSFMKKVRREAGRYQFKEARRKNDLKPVMTLDHLVKERYPRFIDALRDLDDALCMIHLFASLPSTGRVTAERTRSCVALVQHWQYYVARTRCLHKTFVSIKGVYFQCEILGEPITWVTPHKFTQSIPREVDVRVMLTFLEFYEVFLKFTLFKLYHMQGWAYPPTVDRQLDAAGCFLLAVKAEPLEGTVAKLEPTSAVPVASLSGSDATDAAAGALKQKASSKALQAKIDAALSKNNSSSSSGSGKGSNAEDVDSDDDDDDAAPIGGALTEAFSGLYGNADDETDEAAVAASQLQPTAAAAADAARSTLFSRLKFFVNREVPLDWMQLCVVSFGAQVGWEDSLGSGAGASPYSVADAGITHHIVDRPIQGVQGGTAASREYVQPQWVFDCINARALLPTSRYRPGVASLPPHLSPFVDDEQEGYTPAYRLEIQAASAAANGGNANAFVSSVTAPVGSEEVDEDEEEEEEEGEAHQRAVQAEKLGRRGNDKSGTNNNKDKKTKKDKKGVQAKPVEELSEDDGEDIKEPSAGVKGPKGVVYQPKKSNQTEDEESAELARIMMSKKTKRLYGRMQHGLQKKQEGVQALLDKRKQLDEAASSGALQVAPASKKQKRVTKK